MTRKSNPLPEFPANPLTGTSRRTFLKTAACVTLGSLVSQQGFSAAIESNDGIVLVVAPDDEIAISPPAVWAIAELKTALEAKGSSVRTAARLSEAGADEFIVLIAGMGSPVAREILAQATDPAPREPESLCIMLGKADGRPVLLAAGTDATGLMYALTELADRVSCLATSRAALDFAEPVIERPASRIRSIMRGFNSEVEDKAWFYDRDYWLEYLGMLARSRVNRLNFTTGMGYNSAIGVTDGYLLFPYPFFVSVKGFDVRAEGVSDDERARNLAMLKFIAEETVRRGLHFQFGIWTLAYQWVNSPKATCKITGLTDTTHPAYCRDALAVLLREVPQIGGVTFRVHNESGIPKGAESFWDTQFSAVTDCGRRVEIDMHAKNMEPETLRAALATGQPVVVSPKYCGEHLGLPYHQASIREKEMVPEKSITDTGTGVLEGNRGFTRYGYADMLAENRNWDVVFRIWPGTQRFLLNGDPATFAGYGRAAAFCGAAGIELSEPLHFKGRRGSGLPGGRLAYADESLVPKRDFEKYDITYRLWGRLGYHPDANPETWQRAFRKDFGKAAPQVEQALAAASRVLTLFTLAHAPSADCVRYWPEIYTNIPIADTAAKLPRYDMTPPLLFGNASTFDPQLFQSPDECGDALLDDTASGRYTPLEVAQWLENLAESASANLAEARHKSGARSSEPAFRRVEEDVLIQCGLARFFAGKLRCAVLWRIFARSGNRAAGESAITSYTKGRDAWAAMAARAAKIYRKNITYGTSLTSGHWMDRIPAFDADIADLKKRLDTSPAPAGQADERAADRAFKIATEKPVRPLIAAKHTSPESFHAGKDLEIAISLGAPALRVTLHYREVNQARRWKSLVLNTDHGGFSGRIPAAYTRTRYPLQYYFEIETGGGKAALSPALNRDLSNFPYHVVRLAKA